MENRITNSCHSNQVPQGVGPVMIQKPGIRLKNEFSRSNEEQVLFLLTEWPFTKETQVLKVQGKCLNSAPPTSFLSR